ncbi:Golgi membrane exchange factor (Ric1p-Rgp1p) subunit [Exophiala xenobiotica]|nr:Golgi membrane exchange factor (Ric1p-Rgp1p) subunit [Exophiala xenobiotica]
MHSDIHVIVRFHEQSVFAGEELRCTITFKNVANLVEPVSPTTPKRRTSRQASISQIAAHLSRNHGHSRSSQNGRTATDNNERFPDARGRHKATASLQDPIPTNDLPTPVERPGFKQRSVSIISVTSPIATTDHADASSGSWAKQQRLSHRRSSTVQIHHDSHHRTSQLGQASRGSSPQPATRGPRSPLSPAAGRSREATPDFKFPAAAPPTDRVRLALSPGDNNNNNEPATRILSRTSQMTSDERSSGDFYSLSNHSQETLMSEQPSVLSDHHRATPSLSLPLPRNNISSSRPAQKPRGVNLLMGYAQLNATFTLDASLVDQSHFEEVKSKGFLGGQAGGGVVGMKKPRPTSGFLGNFSLKDFGESLNSLISGDDGSSVTQMHAMRNSRAIPLLSTPQSLLFVDMHLEPGEEHSYSYTYPLPRGLPSSHRGKAIKISYNLTVGVQGALGGRDVQHTVRQVNVPVRVFSGVNYDGEIFGHDLMQPHVLLRDLATTKSIISLEREEAEEAETHATRLHEKSTTEFLEFVDKLLDRNQRRQSSSGTMDAFLAKRDGAEGHQGLQAINRAIFYSNQSIDSSSSSSNRFEIARNGLRVAVIVIDRPLHRLGETITAVVDLSESQVSCAALRSTLETTEKVSPPLAVRSAATINRVTRKIYAAHSENVLFAKRVTFAPSIPAAATPTFVTSGVSLDWSLRFEFGTIKPVESEEGDIKHVTDLLEGVVRDERGAINVAVEHLDCETFEVVIPITVYGDLVPDGRESEDIVGIPI